MSQNEDVKRISAWAAIFFAPTLIGTIYGMNFEHMPELGWTLGYPLALLVMVLHVCCAVCRVQANQVALTTNPVRESGHTVGRDRSHDAGRSSASTATGSSTGSPTTTSGSRPSRCCRTVKPGELRAALPADPPEHGERFEAVLRDLERSLLPGITHWQHPSFFAYFPANASGPAILGDLLASGLGVQGMLWATSPAATELETHVLDWLADLLDLPTRFRSAGRGSGRHPAHRIGRRSRRPAGRAAPGERRAHRARGRRTERLTVYTSSQTHSSVEKACRVAGLGTDALRKIDVDPATQAARPEHLRQLIEADQARVTHRRWSWRRSAPPASGRSTRWRNWAGSRAATTRGCTSTRPGPELPRCARSCAGSTTASTSPIPTAPTRTSGC